MSKMKEILEDILTMPYYKNYAAASGAVHNIAKHEDAVEDKFVKHGLSFFKKGFVRLAGNNILQKQIENGKTAKQIRDGWKKGIKKFKNLRKNYLLYD